MPAVTAACQDPEIPRWTVVPHALHRAARARLHLRHRRRPRRAGASWRWPIVDPDDRVLGALGMSNFDWADMKGEIGYWMARGGAPARDRRARHRMLAEWALTTLGPRAPGAAGEPGERGLRSGSPSGPASRARALLRRYRRRHGVREDLVMFSLLAEDLDA